MNRKFGGLEVDWAAVRPAFDSHEKTDLSQTLCVQPHYVIAMRNLVDGELKFLLWHYLLLSFRLSFDSIIPTFHPSTLP
jgi:predicted ATPase